MYFPSLPSSVTTEQWASLTDTNIEKTEEECKRSTTLRGVIDSLLNQSSQDVESQRAKVNLAFEKRTQETTDAKETLEQHLEKVRVSYARGMIPSGKFVVYRASVKTISIHSSGKFISVFSHTLARCWSSFDSLPRPQTILHTSGIPCLF